jgi:hypothetical protein
LFAGNTGMLLLNPVAGAFAGSISGFVAGDVIDAVGLVLDDASYTATGLGIGTLTLFGAGWSP